MKMEISSKILKKYIALQRAIILIKSQLDDFDKELTNEIEKFITETDNINEEEVKNLRELFYDNSNEKIYFDPLNYIKI